MGRRSRGPWLAAAELFRPTMGRAMPAVWRPVLLRRARRPPALRAPAVRVGSGGAGSAAARATGTRAIRLEREAAVKRPVAAVRALCSTQASSTRSEPMRVTAARHKTCEPSTRVWEPGEPATRVPGSPAEQAEQAEPILAKVAMLAARRRAAVAIRARAKVAMAAARRRVAAAIRARAKVATAAARRRAVEAIRVRVRVVTAAAVRRRRARADRAAKSSNAAVARSSRHEQRSFRPRVACTASSVRRPSSDARAAPWQGRLEVVNPSQRARRDRSS